MKRNEIDDYIVTYTEKYFSTSNPRAEDICLEDIAHSLSMMCRFNSHSPVLYSVAQHSIHCAEIAKDIGLSEESQLVALFHDASESYLSDIPKPFKVLLPDYITLEDKIQDLVWEALGVTVTEKSYRPIKTIDTIMLINEITKIMNPKHYTIPEVDFYIDVDMSRILSPHEAKEKFKEMARTLGCDI